MKISRRVEALNLCCDTLHSAWKSAFEGIIPDLYHFESRRADFGLRAVLIYVGCLG